VHSGAGLANVSPVWKCDAASGPDAMFEQPNPTVISEVELATNGKMARK
jgi:hypothetical protein